jgi:ATP/maltotriose-dependent transcriptional regulator MalT
VASPLLEIKLHVPRHRRGRVTRRRLNERLSRGAESALTLVSAPAGFGKTTLLAEWLESAADDGRSTAWLSLDYRDNDPAVFWTYLIAALKTATPGVGGDALSLLQSPQEAIETVLATLLNDLSGVSTDVVLVLDDYHLIESPAVQEGMAFLLDHLPPRLRLVIAGRADPALPLARLRARGELVEIRATDLRFTPDEAATYLNEVMGLVLTTGDVAALEDRTEGWIAALQLAGLSMQGRADLAGFIADFAGDDRYIVDYLAQEVLQRQPDEVRSFLLQTSILSRLGGSLCNAVTGRTDGKAMLERLERGNLFLVPLDDQRRWYRYHHLFGDVLQAHLLDEQPDLVHELHRRASDWYEGNGERPEAIRHAMAAHDLDRAADLVELAIPATAWLRQEATLRGWLDALPDDLIRVRPVLSDGYAGSLLVRGEVEGVESRLQDAERWLDATSGSAVRPPGMVVADEEAFRALPAAVAVHRAGQARIVGDTDGTMTHARRALDLVGEDEHLARGGATALLGLAHWTRGELDEALRLYSDGMASVAKAGYLADLVGSAITVADIQIVQGRLREALATYERGLQTANEHTPPLRGAADMHVGLSVILHERNDLGASLQHLLASMELGEHAGLPQNRYRWRVAMARLRATEGDLDSALDLLDQADGLYVNDYAPDVRPVPALRARVLARMGRVGDALGWARGRGLSVEDDLTYVGEFEHITLAKVLLAQSSAERKPRPLPEVIEFLDRLLRAAEEGARTGSVIEILVLLALSHHARGESGAALVALQGALALAEPEGYVRVFADEGPPMATLLKAAAKQGIASTYVRRLLAAVNNTEDNSRPAGQRLIDPLSERELEVLRLLGSDLDGPDIARRLVVSLNTVRTHTKNIYTKLGVNNRRAAVRRAEELDLMSRTRDR